jgi:hypothetical protein
MGLTKKICIFLFIILGIAFFYQNHVLSQPVLLSPTARPHTVNNNIYMSFSEEGSGSTSAKYAVIDSNSNVQIITLQSEPAGPTGNIISPPKMATGLSGVHFVYDFGGLFSFSNHKVYYEKEATMGLSPEIVPFAYGKDTSNYNGFSPIYSDIAVDYNDEPYIASLGLQYSNGFPVEAKILITKKTQNGWTTPQTLYQFNTVVRPSNEIYLDFDSSKTKGHLYYEEFTNPSCVIGSCPRAVYDLVFSTNMQVLSNNKMVTAIGSIPNLYMFRPILDRFTTNLVFLTVQNINSDPRTTYIRTATSSKSNVWSPQVFLSSSVMPLSYSDPSSVDMVLDSKRMINIVSSEKNTVGGLPKSKIVLHTSATGLQNSWSDTILTWSDIKQHRGVNIAARDKANTIELLVGYVEGAFSQTPLYPDLKLISSIDGAITESTIYQNPSGFNIHLGDMLVK